jgi:2,4-dienoyl-CoA reductase-like NADH-dependent reductase (Old Yellow Enzyme family)/thioredoxin reductase
LSGLEHLLSPITIRNMELPNRVVMPPMGTNLGNDDATVGEALLAYIRRQAKSGAGLIVSEITAVHPSGSVGPNHLGSYDDRFIPGLKKYAAAVHEAGGKTAMQLHHAGRESLFMLMQGEAIGPSGIPSVVFRQPPREMTLEEIHETVQAFGQAAQRAREAGFDAVEVHGAHGYLLTQFLSELSNQREDEYGGSLDKRARFVIEVLRAVREKVGDDFPISLRLSAEECIKGGYAVEDIQTIVPDFVAAGADIIHASLGTHGTPAGITSAPPEYEAGFNVWRAKKLKEVIPVPVIAVGRFTDPAPADKAIARGDADMVAFGRQQLADPDYLIKAKEGRTKDIRICIGCNQGCIERLMFEPGSSVRCAINPETGQELMYPQGPAPTRRTVWVVGAGPAGLTAACEAARLEHTVTLFEKEEKAGGQIFYASKAPFKKLYDDWIQWLIGQVEATGVKLQTDTLVTGDMLDEAQPDVVILAAGAEKIIPPIPGIDLPLVCDAFQILGGEVVPKANVVVVGGGMIGMETADFLIDKGSSVTVVELMPKSPVKRYASHGYMLHKRLRDGGGRLLLGTKVESIGKDSVTIVSEQSGKETLPTDQVVIAVGTKSCGDLKNILAEKGIRHVVVGDANQPRRIIEATEEGAKAAWDI